MRITALSAQRCAGRTMESLNRREQHHSPDYNERRSNMTLGTILLIILVLLLIGALPAWPHSSSWGYYPSGILGLVVVVLLVLLLMGRL
jgi:hypothetical protein